MRECAQDIQRQHLGVVEGMSHELRIATEEGTPHYSLNWFYECIIAGQPAASGMKDQLHLVQTQLDRTTHEALTSRDTILKLKDEIESLKQQLGAAQRALENHQELKTRELDLVNQLRTSSDRIERLSERNHILSQELEDRSKHAEAERVKSGTLSEEKMVLLEAVNKLTDQVHIRESALADHQEVRRAHVHTILASTQLADSTSRS